MAVVSSGCAEGVHNPQNEGDELQGVKPLDIHTWIHIHASVYLSTPHILLGL